MKILLYSGGDNDINEELDQELLQLSKKKKPSITFIPASSEGGKIYYEYIKAYYKKYGINKIYYFPIDKNFTTQNLEKAFDADIIYLSGGILSIF